VFVALGGTGTVGRTPGVTVGTGVDVSVGGSAVAVSAASGIA